MTAKRPFSDKSILYSAIACATGFGGFLVWSATAKLDEGITASGQLVVEDDRKQVQHFEGGIISSLHVREGQVVQAGDILVELAPVQSASARDELAQEYASHLASLERLEALADAADTVSFPETMDIPLDDRVREEIIARQTALYRQQRASFDAELTVLRTRRAALEGRSRDLTSQISAIQRSLTTAREDLTLRRELLAERHETISNVQELDRMVSGLEGDRSRLVGERNEARKNAEEIAGQIAELEAQFQEQLSRETVDSQAKAFAARERLLALDDRLARTIIRAPQAGTVLNLKYSTLGGVVTQGDTIMEIVPDTGDLIANVRLRPTDRDAVQPGQAVEAQLTAYKSFIAPRLPGEVLNVSADLKQDETNGAFFYEARVRLDTGSLDPNARIEIIPGMPVEAFIASGNSRTFLDYTFEPIFATLTRGTRMSQ